MPTPNATVQIEQLSESLLIVRLGDSVDGALNTAALALARRIEQAGLHDIVDIAPAYCSVSVRFRPERWASATTAFASISAALQPFLYIAESDAVPSRWIEIPVCYGGEYGIDLDYASAACGMSEVEFVDLHKGASYRVAMLGFAPGFPYLLGLPAALQMPRRSAPRLRVPAGSVAIGGAQTGIYPTELPGGWHLIGRTPLCLFDSESAWPSLLTPGDGVRFRAIDTAEFNHLSRKHPA